MKTLRRRNIIIKATTLCVVILLFNVIIIPGAVGFRIQEYKKEKLFDISAHILGENDTFQNITVNGEHVNKIITVFQKFIDEKGLKVEGVNNSEIYNSEVFKKLIEEGITGSGVESELLTLVENINRSYTLYFETMNNVEEGTKIIVGEVISYFKSLFNQSNENYVNFTDTYGEVSQELADRIGKIYNQLSKTKMSAFQNNVNVLDSLSLDQFLVALCTFVFLANWLMFGRIIGSFTQPIIALILAVLLIVPSLFILISDVVIGNVDAFIEAALAAVIVIVDFYVSTGLYALEMAGLLGFLLWLIAAMYSFQFLPIVYFVFFIVCFYEDADIEPGYVIENLGPFICEVLERAAENAWEIYNEIFNNSFSFTSVLVGILQLLRRLRYKFSIFKVFVFSPIILGGEGK